MSIVDRPKRKEVRSLDAPWSVTQDERKSSEINPNKFWAAPDDLYEISQNAGTVSCYDWNHCYNKSNQDRSDELYVWFSNIMYVLIQKGASGYFWLAASEPMCALLELSSGFQAISFDRGKLPFDNQRKFGTGEVVDRGTVWKRWRLYECDRINSNDIIMGCGNECINDPSDLRKYARIRISNYII